MDKYVYRKILETKFTNTIYMQDIKEENVIFKHNNDPIYSPKYVKDWLLA
jgi:hypothetical protein